MRNIAKISGKTAVRIAYGYVLTALFASLVAIGGSAFFAFESRLSNIQEEYLESQERLQSAFIKLEQEANVLEDNLKETETKSAEEIKNLQNQISSISESNESYNIDAIAAEWEKRTAFLLCFDANGNRWSGSGTAISLPNGTVTILSNFHVLGAANICYAVLPDDSTYAIPASSFFWDESPYDWAIAIIAKPSLKLYENAKIGDMSDRNNVDLGDEVLILGYPSVGSSETVTVTRGIISGLESAFYVTDAKIEHGSSGGVAVHLETNSFLGIPTGAAIGSIESYGRILRADVIF